MEFVKWNLDKRESLMLKKTALCLFIAFLVFGSDCIVSPGKIAASLIKADKVVLIKSRRILMLMRLGEIFRTYRVALGQKPKGQKMKAGDKKTPEGTYILDSRNPDSKFHLAIHISYPNKSDAQNARKLGVSPGGGVMIHGLPDDLRRIGKLHRLSDWTNGCIAVTNPEIEEIWRLVPDGTPIEIKP
jgi:murein L,D-transpeptidase YafK